MNKAACEVRSSARGSNLLPSPNQSQASSAVISCSTSVEHTPSNVNSCSTSVQHNPSNVNSTSTTTPDSGLKSEPKLEHQKPKPGSKKKVKFSQEEVEEEGTHESLQPPSNVTSSNAQVRNVDVSYQKLNTRMYISKKYQAAMCELISSTADISKSLDHTVLTSSCYVCDPRMKPLVNEAESLEPTSN